LHLIESFTAEELKYAIKDNIKNEVAIKTGAHHF